MTFKPPADLARLQQAFGRSISVPLEIVDVDGNYEVQVDRYDLHAVTAVQPRGSQTGAERIAVYNQQYWFRLLSVMQEEFPLTEALLGLQAFNALSIAYLDACPPDSPRLRDLSNRFEAFANERVEPWAAQSIALERIYIESFDAADRPAIDPASDREALLEHPIAFQPHVAVFDTDFNLVELRRRVKQGGTVDRSSLEAHPSTWVLWRGQGVQAVALGPIQAQLLSRMFDGEPLAQACEELVATLDDSGVEFLVTHVQRWFAAWAVAGWFAAAR